MLISDADANECVVDHILTVGSPDKKHMLAFQPKNSYRYDSVIVMPREDGGRVIFLIQCTNLKSSVAKSNISAEARWERQQGLLSSTAHHEARGTPSFRVVNNPFKELLATEGTRRFASDPLSPYARTDYVFVLASVESVLDDHGSLELRHASYLANPNKTGAGTLPDEAFVDLKWMEAWCPTVAYALQATSQLWSAIHDLHQPHPHRESPTTETDNQTNSADYDSLNAPR